MHSEYAVTVWYPYETNLSGPNKNLQKRATRQLPGCRNLIYEERIKQLKVPTLAYCRARGV